MLPAGQMQFDSLLPSPSIQHNRRFCSISRRHFKVSASRIISAIFLSAANSRLDYGRWEVASEDYVDV